MNQWHYNKIKQLKDWERDLRAVLAFKNYMDEETRKDTVRYISLLDYAIEQIERVQELEDKLARIRFINNDYNKTNKRYREVIEEALVYADSPKILTNPAGIEKILAKALEGEE